MPLFEVAILEKPTKKEIEEGKSDRIVMKPTPVVAADQQSAAIAAVLDTESLGPVDRNRMEVLVRPFV